MHNRSRRLVSREKHFLRGSSFFDIDADYEIYSRELVDVEIFIIW